MKKMNRVEVCFSPLLFPRDQVNGDAVIVVVDVLRATTAMTAAIANGAEEVLPVADLAALPAYKEKGYFIASERDGLPTDIADYTNSPLDYYRNDIAGKSIAFSTTNGTQAIELVKDFPDVILGSFSNVNAVTEYVIRKNKDCIILCAGWKNTFSLEDTLFAGALSRNLIENGFMNSSDSVTASVDLWSIAETDLLAYAEKCTHRHRLKTLKMDESLEYCFTLNTTTAVARLKNGVFVGESV